MVKTRYSVTYRIYLNCGHTEDKTWFSDWVATMRPKKDDAWTCPIDHVTVYVDSVVKLKDKP